MEINYEELAEQFLKDTQTKFSYKCLGVVDGFPNDDKDHLPHFKFRAKLNNSNGSYSFNFYGSFNDYQKNIQTLTPYDVLSCMTKYDVGTFDNFINEYGYTFETEKRYLQVKAIYKAVIKEYKAMLKLFSEHIEALHEIA